MAKCIPIMICLACVNGAYDPLLLSGYPHTRSLIHTHTHTFTCTVPRWSWWCDSDPPADGPCCIPSFWPWPHHWQEDLSKRSAVWISVPPGAPWWTKALGQIRRLWCVITRLVRVFVCYSMYTQCYPSDIFSGNNPLPHFFALNLFCQVLLCFCYCSLHYKFLSNFEDNPPPKERGDFILCPLCKLWIHSNYRRWGRGFDWEILMIANCKLFQSSQSKESPSDSLEHILLCSMRLTIAIVRIAIWPD